MFGLSMEHLILLAIVLVIFGPKRVPELGHSIGRAMKNFKDELAGVKQVPFRRIEDKVESSGANASGNSVNDKTTPTPPSSSV